MPITDDVPYAKGGNTFSEQAEPSTENRAASTIQMRILIELQVISMILANAYEITDQLPQLRQEAADSIT